MQKKYNCHSVTGISGTITFPDPRNKMFWLAHFHSELPRPPPANTHLPTYSSHDQPYHSTSLHPLRFTPLSLTPSRPFPPRPNITPTYSNPYHPTLPKPDPTPTQTPIHPHPPYLKPKSVQVHSYPIPIPSHATLPFPLPHPTPLTQFHTAQSLRKINTCKYATNKRYISRHSNLNVKCSYDEALLAETT